MNRAIYGANCGVPHSLTLWDAATAPEGQAFLPYGPYVAV